MEENIKFSILVPAFKARFLGECIDSILAQTYKNLELIIVNDASPENLGEIVSKYNDSRIQYYVNEKNFGAINVVDNWNKCLSYATGDYVICMGDDDKLLPCCLEEYLKLIVKFPEVGVLHGMTAMIDETSKVIAVQEPRLEFEDAFALVYFRLLGRHQYIGDFLYKRDVLLQNGGFYKLPLAWGSDDLSAVIAAKDGIANTSKVVFLYRDNLLTISNTGNTRLKAETTLEFKQLLKEQLLKQDNKVVLDFVKQCLLDNYDKLFKVKLYYAVLDDVKSDMGSLSYWYKRRKILGMTKTKFFKMFVLRIKSLIFKN